MSESVRVRRDTELPEGLDELVAESARDGLRLVARLRDDWESGANRFEGPGEAFFVARVGPELAGVCGLNRDPFVPDPQVGRVRRLYVPRRFRRRGVARRLVEALLEVARDPFAVVRVRTTDPGAAAFYEAIGFARVPGARDASHERSLRAR